MTCRTGSATWAATAPSGYRAIAPSPPSAGTVADDQDLHLEVAVKQDSDPIRGTLDDGAGTTIEFTGWLELMSAFDTARARTPDTAPKTDPATDRQ